MARRFLFLLLLTLGLALGIVAPGIGGDRPSPPPLLLANIFHEQIDVSRYWVSEKLDGVRAYWDGKALFFRSGQRVHAPDWFTAGFPAQELDGELWIGRGQFDRVSGIARKQQAVEEEWRQIRYMVFELPNAPGSFTQRLERMREIIRLAGLPWLQAVEQFRASDIQVLKQRMQAVLGAGGEGLMLHLADAPYEIGRGDALLKLKPWLDAEATVIGHVPGRGRFQGMLGALQVKTEDGRRFRIGTGFKDTVRRAPPPVGTLITYRYRELNRNGLPRFASFMRVREDF